MQALEKGLQLLREAATLLDGIIAAGRALPRERAARVRLALILQELPPTLDLDSLPRTLRRRVQLLAGIPLRPDDPDTLEPVAEEEPPRGPAEDTAGRQAAVKQKRGLFSLDKALKKLRRGAEGPPLGQWLHRLGEADAREVLATEEQPLSRLFYADQLYLAGEELEARDLYEALAESEEPACERAAALFDYLDSEEVRRRHAALLRERARALLADGEGPTRERAARACALAEQAIGLVDDDPESWRCLGECQQAAGHTEDALESFAECASQGGGNPALAVAIARARRAAGELLPAQAGLELASRLEGRALPIDLELAGYRADSGDVRGALELLAPHVDELCEHGPSRWEKGRLDALEARAEGIARASSHPEALLLYGRVLAARERDEPAAEVLRAAAEASQDFLASYELARVLVRLHAYTPALAALDDAERKRSSAPEIFLLRAKIHEEQGLSDKAREALERAALLDAEEAEDGLDELAEQAEAERARARELLAGIDAERDRQRREQRLEQAIACLRRALRAVPDEGTRAELSEALVLREGGAEEALSLVLEDVAAAEDPSEGLVAVGRARLAMGDEAKAEGAWRSALSLSPDNAAAHCALGRLYLDQDKLPAALEHLDRACAGEDVPEEAWQAFAIAALESGDFARCRTLALQLDPGLEWERARGRSADPGSGADAEAEAASEADSASDPATDATPAAASDGPADPVSDDPPASATEGADSDSNPASDAPPAAASEPEPASEAPADSDSDSDSDAAAPPPTEAAAAAETDTPPAPEPPLEHRVLALHLALACAAAAGEEREFQRRRGLLLKVVRGEPLAKFFRRGAPRDLPAIVARWHRLAGDFSALDELLAENLPTAHRQAWRALSWARPRHGVAFGFDPRDRYEVIEDEEHTWCREEKTQLAELYCELAQFFARWARDRRGLLHDPDWPPRRALFSGSRKLSPAVRARRALSELHAAAGRPGAGMQVLRRALAWVEGSASAPLLARLAELAAACGDRRRAEEYRKRARSADPNTLPIPRADDPYADDRRKRATRLLGRARLAYQARDLDAALELAERARYVDPTLPAVHGWLARIQRLRGAWVEAARHSADALALDDAQSEAREVAAELATDAGRAALAADWFERAQAATGPAAFAAVDASLAAVDDPPRRLWKAEQLAALGRSPVVELRAVDPRRLSLAERQRYFLCLLGALRGDEHRGALQAAARTAAAALADWPEPWRVLGDSQLADAALADALASYREGLRRAPEDLPLAFAAAETLARLGRSDEALEAGLAAASQVTDADLELARLRLARLGESLAHPPALTFARVTVLRRLGRRKDALALLEELEPAPRTFLEAVAIEREAGRQQPALALLEAGLRRFPGDPALALEAAEVHVLRGQPERAAAVLRGCPPGHDGVALALEELADAARARVRAGRQKLEEQPRLAPFVAHAAIQDAALLPGPEAWLLAGDAHLTRGDAGPARGAFENAWERAPGDPRAAAGRARALRLAGEPGATVLRAFLDAAALDTSVALWQTCAELAYLEADWPALMQSCAQLALYRPRVLRWHLAHALAEVHAGRPGHAEPSLARLAPRDHDAALAWLAVRTVREAALEPALEALAAHAPEDPFLAAEARGGAFLATSLSYCLLVSSPLFADRAARERDRFLAGYSEPARSELARFWRALPWRAPYVGQEYDYRDGRYEPVEDERHQQVRARKATLGRLAWSLGEALAQLGEPAAAAPVLDALAEKGPGEARFVLAERLADAAAPTLASALYAEAFAELPSREAWKARLGEARCLLALGQRNQAAQAALAVLRKKTQQPEARALLASLDASRLEQLREGSE